MLPTTRFIQTATRQDLAPMDRFLNEGQAEFRAREPDEIPQDDGSLPTEALSTEDLPTRQLTTRVMPPQIVPYLRYKQEIISFKTPNVIKTHTAIRENLRQECELHRINLHTLLLVVRDGVTKEELPNCGDVFYLESVLRKDASMIIFMAPEDSNMAWITWSQNPFPGGENGPVFQFFQKLVTAGDLHVNNCYLPGARDHRAVYELAHIATMTASNPNPRDRYNGLQDYDVIEYASQNALVDAITRYTFTQPVTPLMSHAFAEYVENLHEEEYPSDRLETILARYGINAWAPDELEDEEPYWEQYPPQIHPTIREGTLVPNYLLRDPETGAFRQDEGYTYARWGGDGWVILPTPAGVVEATAAGMAEAAPDGMAEVNDVGVGEATAVGRDEATRAGAQEEEEESEDLNEVRVVIPADITDPPLNTLYLYRLPRIDELEEY